MSTYNIYLNLILCLYLPLYDTLVVPVRSVLGIFLSYFVKFDGCISTCDSQVVYKSLHLPSGDVQTEVVICVGGITSESPLLHT